MTFLPIFERELRIRARRPAGYWTRFGVALTGLLLYLPQLLFSGPLPVGPALGKTVFDAIVTAAFLLSCSACLLASDALDTERKEGTLGLLWLTRVRPLDLLLGKLGSVGLTSLCSLLAFAPILLIPVLAGGVTPAEAVRKSLALLTTLIESLALGFWAVTNGRQRSFVRSPLVAVALVVVPPWILWLLYPVPLKHLGVLSPLIAVLSAGDLRYGSAPPVFWSSVICGLLVAGLALVLATRRLRPTGDEPVGAELPEPEPGEPDMMPSPNRWASASDQTRPVDWLVRRQRGIRARLWAAAGLSCVFQLSGLISPRWWGATAPGTWFNVTYWMPSFVVSGLESALIASAVSHFFLETRRTGELELLLTTPVGAKTVLSEQWRTLGRLLRGPVLVMLVPPFIHLVIWLGIQPWTARGPVPFGYEVQVAVSIGTGILGLLLHVAALCWLGMWFGLKARGRTAAIAWCVVLSTGMSYLISVISSVLLASVLSRLLGAAFRFYFFLSVPTMMVIGLNLGLLIWSHRRLTQTLGCTGRVRLWHALLEIGSDPARAFQQLRHWTPSA